MLTTALLARALGNPTPTTAAPTFAHAESARQLFALQPAPSVRFDGHATAADRSLGSRTGSSSKAGAGRARQREDEEGEEVQKAHRAGVNCLAVEPFEGRYMVSGGADGGVRMWDLEQAEARGMEEGEAEGKLVHVPIGTVERTATSHTHGVTAVSFYTFDSGAFLSSSFDHTLKIYSSFTLQASASFDLGSVVYAHAISPIALHLNVACATQHPAVRLVDLRTGASTHSLAGPGGGVGSVLSVAWSPRIEHVLASGGTDGIVRFWDVRSGAGPLGQLDAEDSIGVVGYDGLGTGARRSDRGIAHQGPVNGIVWSEDGQYVVTAGHDERVRVWDTTAGANTLANFGPVIKNKNLSPLIPLLAPRWMVPKGQGVLFYPNEREILMLEMFEGSMLKRLRPLGISQAHSRKGQQDAKNRVTALAWRAHCVEMLSAHADGVIRSWQPRTTIDAFVDDPEQGSDNDGEETEGASRKRKRQVLDDIYRDLTTQKITFT